MSPHKRYTSSRALTALRCLLLVAFFCTIPSFAQKTKNEGRDDLKSAVRFTRSNELEKGEVVLRKLINSNPKNEKARTELAFNLTKQRRFVEAYETILSVLEQDKKDTRALSVLGSLLLASGRLPEARAIVYRALELDRGEDLAWASLGMLDFYDNNVDLALKEMKQAVYLANREPDYYFALAQACVRAEHYRDAAEAYNRFLEVSGSMDADRRDRIKGLVSFLLFLGDRPSLFDASGKSSASVPFELVNDRPIITVALNGKPSPFKFVIDTGSGMTVVSKDVADALGIKEVARGGTGRGIGGSGKFDLVYGFVNEISIGEASVHNVPVYIRELRSSHELDGYIGLSLISKFFTTIDYGTHLLSLSEEDTNEVFSKANADHVLPLRLTPSGFLSGEVGVEGIATNLNFIVDTAASMSVISDNVAAADSIKKYLSDARYSVLGLAGETKDVPAFLLPRVTFGTNSRAPLLAVALDLEIINEASGFDQSGILGGNFLRNYRVAFDFKRSRVKLTPLSSASESSAGRPNSSL
jgi:tetratricopeptide (TPR) repeat protein/predicted aspartyl protease